MLGVKLKRAKIVHRNDKKFRNDICHAPYLKNRSSYDTQIEVQNDDIFTGIFFMFSKFWLIFQVVRGVKAKAQKIAQNEKKILSLSISPGSIPPTPLVVHKFKMIITPGTFFIFSKFWLYGFFRRIGQKMAQQNDKQLCLSHHISQIHHYMIFIYCAQSKRMISPGIFYIFTNLIFGV